MDTIILIPGHGCKSQVFKAQMQALSTSYHFICIDLCEYHSIDKVINDILNKAPKQFFILGFSLGAAIALDITQRVPERIKGHIHISLPFEGPSDFLVEDLKRVKQALEQMSMSEFSDLAYAKYFPHKPVDDPLHSVLTDMLVETGKIHYLEQAQMLLEPWKLIPSAHDNHPVLILGGELDQRAKPEYHRMMAERLRNATLHLLPDSGHFVTLEQPGLSSRIIFDWLVRL